MTHGINEDNGQSRIPRADDPLAISAAVKSSIKLLVVDDERSFREGCASVIQMHGYAVATADDGHFALEQVRRRAFDIILVDLYMTPVSGMEIMSAALQAHPDTIVIMMTGNPSVSSSIEALRAGAWDYLPKPFGADHLEILLGRAAHAVTVARETKAQNVTSNWQTGVPSGERATVISGAGGAPGGNEAALLGVNHSFLKAVDLARQVARTDASVMINGESGTGKEVIAQFIHQHSRRASRKFVPINCAALPEALLESELFGHKKGAFTGADRDKPGLFEVANGGTLFLDELTEMSPPLQAKLLRVIQDGVVRRVGSEQQDAVVDVRLLSATNRNPRAAVENGVLRQDLFYRLSVVPILLPALRNRPEDIPLLANHFLAHYWKRHGRIKEKLPVLSDDTISFLQTRSWLGNVRELQNVMEHLSVLAAAGQVVNPDDVPMRNEVSEMDTQTTDWGDTLDNAYHIAKEGVITKFEKEYVRRLVVRAGSNMSRAARLAHMDRTTLYRLIEKHNFRREETFDDISVDRRLSSHGSS